MHDPERLLRILKNPERPAQLILAGKAHPADGAGQAMIQAWTHFIRRSDSSPPVIFLADYDMLLAEQLVQGIDVWINTPRRPWEASGTSGMKVLVNGGLNLSELDGWWAEAYTPEVGWALGDRQTHEDEPSRDAAEAEALYDRLEREVIPEFYARDDRGLPKTWIAKIRESMARLTPRFSAARTVCEYAEKRYVPAAGTYRRRAAERGAEAKKLVDWQTTWSSRCVSIRFDDVTVETRGGQHFFAVKVFLGKTDPTTVRVELYANSAEGSEAVKQEMSGTPDGTVPGSYTYRTTVSSARPTVDYAARIMPHCDGLAVPLEADWILWQK